MRDLRGGGADDHESGVDVDRGCADGWHRFYGLGRSLRGRRLGCDRGGDCGLALVLKALATENRASLGRLEGDGGLDAALGAVRAGFGARDARGGWPGAVTHGGGPGAARLAGLAALGVVLELLVEEKELFAGGKDELPATVNACQ